MMHRVSIWHLLWRMIRYTFGLYLLDSFLWMFIMGLPAIPGLIIREFFNTLTDNSQINLSPQTLIVLLLTVGLARIIAIFTGRITKTQHRFTMSSLLRRNLLEQLLHCPGAQPLIAGEKGPPLSPGEVLSFFREDAAQIEDNVVGTNEILGAGLFALVSLIILLTVNARLTILVFLPLVVIAAIVQRAETRIKRYRRASRQSTQQVTGLLGEMFSAVQAIQVAGAETKVLNHFRQLNEQRRRLMVQDQVFTTMLGSILENLVNIGTGLILLVAARFIAADSAALTVGDFALFVYYLSFVTEFFWFFGGFLALSKQTEVAFERMTALLSGATKSSAREEHPAHHTTHPPSPSSPLVAAHPLYLPNLQGHQPPLPPIAQPSWTENSRLQELVAVNLTYRYSGNQESSEESNQESNQDGLHHAGIFQINLRLQQGSFTVVTGRVGAGKTTLLRVLLGLLPMQTGEIYWNQQHIADPAQFFVPPHSAYTPQAPQLFSNTLRENLLLGLQAGDSALMEAIQLSIFDFDLATMPNGLETVIGPKGMRLSGGQLQRAAAARMFVRQPELLVFDDLSSALDVETEQRLWSRIFAMRNTRWTPTCLVVSHRPSVLRQADHIIVLRNGRVAAEGQFDELLNTCDEVV